MVDKKMNQSSDDNLEFEKALKACRPTSQKQSVGEIMFAAGRAAQRQEEPVQTAEIAPVASQQPQILRWQITTAASLLISVACLGALVWQSTNSPINSTDSLANSSPHEEVDPISVADNEVQPPQPTAGANPAVKSSNRIVPALWMPNTTQLYSPLGRRSRMIKLAAQQSFVDFDAPAERQSEPSIPLTGLQLIKQYSNDENF